MNVRIPRGCGALAAAALAVCLGAACLGSACARAAGPVDATPADAAPAVPAAPAAVTGASPAAPLTPAGPAEDIRDIRGPRAVLPAWLIPAVLAGIAALCLGAYGLWRWRRRPALVKPLLPSEVALQRLEEIRALMRPDGVRAFSVAVSDVVRRYIEERFHVTAARRTTEEFLHDLLTSGDAGLVRHRDLLEEFLRQCDLAKFADMSLSAQNMESLHHSARAFVLETAAPEAPVPRAKAAAVATP